MKKIVLILICSFIACQNMVISFAQYTGEINHESMFQCVTELSKSPRGLNNAERKLAQEYIKGRFEEYGLAVEEQFFSSESMTQNGEKYNGINIIGRLFPNTENKTDDILILCAHYDGIDNVPAANDNASGVSVILELARVLSSHNTDTEIRFIAFDAEEVGMAGSNYYISNLKEDKENIIGVLNFDYLASKKEGKVKLYSGDGTENYLFDILKKNSLFADIEVLRQTALGSDHIPFALQAIPNLMFSHEVVDGEYHSMNDTINTISSDMLYYAAKAGEIICKEIMSIETPSYKQKVNSDTEKVYNVTRKMRIPVINDIKEFTKKTGISVTQMKSDNFDLKYKAEVLFGGFPGILYIEYPVLSSISDPNYYIEINVSNTDFFKLSNVMNDNYEQVTEKTWISIYGNTYEIVDDGDKIIIYISEFPIDNHEGYIVMNGDLIRTQSASPFLNVKFYKENGEISYLIEQNVNIVESSVSEHASKCWEKVKELIGEVKGINFINIYTDGIGGANTGIMMSQSNIIEEEIKAYIENNLSSMQDGDEYVVGFSMGGGINLSLDYLDILHNDGISFETTEFIKNFNIAKATCKGGKDIPSEWSLDSVVKAIEINVLPETLQKNYQTAISREEFCDIAFEILKYNNINFAKQEKDVWFSDTDNEAIIALYDLGIVNGYNKHLFMPNEKITREQAATILNRILILFKKDILGANYKYTDDGIISDYARESVYNMHVCEIMVGTGNGLFEPNTSFSREQAIVTLMRLNNYIS